MVSSVALMAAFVVGIITAIIGALKLDITKKLDIDNVKVGGLISAIMFTQTIMVLIVGPLVDVYGAKLFAIIGYVVSFVGAFLFINAKSYKIAFIGSIFLGAGASCLTTIANVLGVVVLFGGSNPPAAISLATTFFGLGAFFTPFIIGILLKKVGYKVTGNLISVIVLLPIFFAIVAQGFPNVQAGFEISQAFGLLTKNIVIICSLVLFCYVGLEISMGGWVSSYASEIGFSDRGANLALSSYWICLMFARLTTAGFGIKPLVTPEIGIKVAMVLAVLAIIVIGFLTIVKSKSLALLGIALMGLIFGPIYPNLLGVTLGNPSVVSVVGSAYGIIQAIGLLGASIIPAAIGVYSKGKTIQKSFKIAVVTAVVMLIGIIIMAQV